MDQLLKGLLDSLEKFVMIKGQFLFILQLFRGIFCCETGDKAHALLNNGVSFVMGAIY